MEGPDEWIDYDLGSLIAIRDELMEGDLRSLYIVWLAGQNMMVGYYGDEEDEEDEEDISVLPVPPGFATLTAAQAALAELLQVQQELLVAAGRHSIAASASMGATPSAASKSVQQTTPRTTSAVSATLSRNIVSASVGAACTRIVPSMPAAERCGAKSGN